MGYNRSGHARTKREKRRKRHLLQLERKQAQQGGQPQGQTAGAAAKS